MSISENLSHSKPYRYPRVLIDINGQTYDTFLVEGSLDDSPDEMVTLKRLDTGAEFFAMRKEVYQLAKVVTLK